MKSYIETYTGKKFYFLDPSPDSIDIVDIAHALSMICRYTGHCNRFYSVAEHSVHVANLLPEGLKLAGLLHDASEAYITDIASPIKQHLPDYQKMEDTLCAAIYAKYKLEYPSNALVKAADYCMLSTEAHYLLPSRGNDWDLWKFHKRPLVLHEEKPLGLPPDVSELLFIEKFKELTHGQV